MDVVYGLMILWELPSALVPIQLINMTHHPKSAMSLVPLPALMDVVFGHTTFWDSPNVIAMMKIINMTHQRKNAKHLAPSPAQMIAVSGRITFWGVHSALAMRMEPITTKIPNYAKLHQNARSLVPMKDASGHMIS